MAVTLEMDNVIQGWTEGLQLMVEGERTRSGSRKTGLQRRPGQATRDAGVRHRSHQDRAAHHDAVLTETLGLRCLMSASAR